MKKILKVMEFSIKILPTPHLWKKLCFKMLSITQFSENFEDKIIICLILKVMTIEVEVIKSNYQSEILT